MAEGLCKIGFHLAEGGNPSGIGNWMSRLNAAGIPFFIKTADSMRGLDEAQDLVRQNRADGKEVPHVIVFRRSGKLDDNDHFDIPRYDLEPEEAAIRHWRLHRDRFPSNLDPAITWVETINEVRKEVEWCDWLGQFSYHTGKLAVADGFRYAAFGFSSGTPDVTDGAWETDGMRRYLELCAEYPDRLGVALHEYSYSIADIWRLSGFLVGGFAWLFRAADKMGIPRPKVLITEWGWESENVPAPDVALRHIEEVGALYARYPEVLGAAIWYLGGGYGGIADRAQKLVGPVTEFALGHRYALAPNAAEVLLPEEEVGSGTFPVPRDGWRLPGFGPSARLVADSVPTVLSTVAGEPFTFSFRLGNDGQASWGTGCHLRQLRGPQLSPPLSVLLPNLAPDDVTAVTLALTAPEAAGDYRLRWRLAQASGQLFGDAIDLDLAVSARPVAPGNSRYLADVTVPDHSTLVAGTQFVKIWRVLNNGARTWLPSDRLVHVSGDEMAPAAAHPVPATPPGETAELSVSLTAPAGTGSLYTEWRLANVAGELFGDFFYALINVTPPFFAMRFVSDVAVPFGALMTPGRAFRKTWLVENTGNTTWALGTRLVPAGGEAFGSPNTQPVDAVPPGASAPISLDLRAPTSPGRHRGEWRLVTPDGSAFGDRLVVLVEVLPG